jgi:hypothetical protein
MVLDSADWQGELGRLSTIAHRPHAFQQQRRRLVVGVLGDKPAGKGPLEDGLAQAFDFCVQR